VSEVPNLPNPLPVDASMRDMNLREMEQARRKSIIIQKAREGYTIGEQCRAARIDRKTHADYRHDDSVFLVEWQAASDEAGIRDLERTKMARGRRRQRAEMASIGAQAQLLTVAKMFSLEGQVAPTEALEAQAREDPQGFAVKAAMAAKVADDLDARAFGLDEKENTEDDSAHPAASSAPLLVRDIDAFIYEDLGLARGSVYRRVVWQLRHIDRPDVRRALLCEAKASGKGWICSLVLARALQRVFAATPDELRTVYKQQGSRPRIGVINLSASGENQAQLAVFTDLRRWLAGPWFARVPKPTRDTADLIEWDLPDRIIVAFCGNSSSTGAEGINFVAAVADEVCRLPDKQTSRVETADALVAPVEATMVTRFGDIYKLVAASWPESKDDYLHRQIALVRDAGGKDGERAGVREDLTASILAEPMSFDAPDAARDAELRAAPFSEYPTESFLSKDATFVVRGPVWAFRPDVSLAALRQMEQRDPAGFAGMVGASPKHEGANAYYKDPECVARGANPKIVCPLDDAGQLKSAWVADPSTLYFGHVDAALGKKGGDAAGLAVAHWGDGRVVVDAMWEARAPEGRELDLDTLVEWFIPFQRQGATFSKVTRDGWEGVGIGQRFRQHGIKSELFSVVRDRRAYDTFRDTLFAGLVDYFPYEPFHENARALVLVGRKVDHTGGPSVGGRNAKDVHDAVSAVVYHVIEKMGRFAGLAVAQADPPDEKQGDPDQLGR